MSLRRAITITNETQHLSRVRATVSEILDESPFDAAMRNKIIVAVDEALANVVEHAYGGETGDIHIAFELDAEQLQVVIRDKGDRFDPGSRLASTLDIHNHIRLGLKGGLGLFLMRQIMDDVRFSGGDEWTNELIMIKKIPGGGDG